jgi:hypothetical protein
MAAANAVNVKQRELVDNAFQGPTFEHREQPLSSSNRRRLDR